jgi:avidin family protein
MLKKIVASLLCVAVLMDFGAASAADYTKRVQSLDESIRTKLVGKWTNPVDKVVIEISSVDLASGQIKGKEWPTTGQAAGDEHDLIGWVSAAPKRENFDNVIPVTFSTTLHEYGTLPVWAGFLRDESIVTMHYLVWPNKTYTWDHISTFQETWSRVP